MRFASGDSLTDINYTGQRQEPDLGFYYYKARWYDPALGRFMQADSIVPGVGNPMALDRYAYVKNSPIGYIDPTGYKDVSLDPKGGGGWCEDSNGDWMCDASVDFDAASLWDPEYFESVGDPKSAEEAFQHFVNDPGYFVNLYANPSLWKSSSEVLNLEVFAQYSILHTTAEILMMSFFSAEDASAISDAHRYWGLGLKEDAYAILDTTSLVPIMGLAGVSQGLSISDMITTAETAYPKLAGKFTWHHNDPKYLGGDPKGLQYRIPAPYHQWITNEFRRNYGYGQPRPNEAMRRSIMENVYSKYPIPPGSDTRGSVTK